MTKIQTSILTGIFLFSFACAETRKPAASAGGESADVYLGLDLKEKENPSLKPVYSIPDRREFPVSAKAKACDNFYEYACKPVIDSFALRPDRSRHVFAFSDSHERILSARMNYFANLHKEKGLSPRMTEVFHYYQACMNEPAAKAEEIAYVGRRMKLVQAMKSREQFLDFLGSQVGTGERSYIDFGSVANLDNPDVNDVYFVTSARSLPEHSYYERPEVIEAWKKVIAKFYQTLGFEDAQKRAEWVAEFEIKLDSTYPLPKDFRKIFNEKTELKREDLLGSFPYLRAKFALDTIPKSTLLRNLMPKNFAALDEMLKSYDLEKLKSIFLWHDLAGVMDDAYPDFFQTNFDFRHQFLGGPPQRSPRQERCTTATMDSFGPEIDEAMIGKLFPNFPRKKVVALAEKIRREIIAGLERNSWLSEDSRKGALHKMKSAGLDLVAPTKVDDWDFNPFVQYSKQSPIKNSIQLAKAQHHKMVKRLFEPRSRTRWMMSPLEINAYYSPSDNRFVLPQGILQYPMFDPNSSEKENLGGLGAVIAHELGHGVDDQGAKYDAAGKLKQWMSDQDIQKFKEAGARMEGLYNAVGHDGALTLGENVADLVGLTFAYHAAFPPKEKVSQADQQKFFLGWARTWCQVILPKQAEKMLKTDSHAASWARVNLQVVHQPGFYEAYGCKQGDRMFLEAKDRVAIW